LSYWRPDRPLIDPFCGTGTIPIEAALIGRRIAPGLKREFAAEAWPRIPAQAWREARTEAHDLITEGISGFIMGSDIDAAVLDVARHNAANAGVANDIHFQQQPFGKLSSRKLYGCVICNPPYGERLSDRPEVRELYASMPAVLRNLRTWSHYILTSYRGFEQLIGQPADRRRKLYNGPIECTYYQFQGPKPDRPRPDTPEKSARETRHAEPAVQASGEAPAFGGITPKMREQARAFGDRLAKRARHLRRWPAQLGITCYRLYERDIPEVPLVVDRYADRLHISEYERPHSHTPGEHADWLDLMAHTASETLAIPRTHVFVKYRAPQRGSLQHERQADLGHTIEVTEGGLKFLVNLSDYIDTGLFLDHRITRSMVREAARGKRFLNLFGYTGTFTVYAAAGGTLTTTTVDLSNTYLEWARHNMALNGFTGKEHAFIREDALGFLAQHPHRASYDLAVVDPPTFSNSKSMETIWDIQRDHVGLLNRVLALMSPGGLVFFSTNFRRFRLDADAIAAATIREISAHTVPADFRNRKIHRAWQIVRGA
jgi:23S rRNA (guanine2445-N2)-methyltransferase / 23S rRNA (guanine2069-N7)-methyltransferase